LDGHQSELPFITICMPVYNSNWSLKRVLEALYNLDYPKKLLRHVFVDNYSTDGSYELLNRFKDENETLYEHIVLARDPKKGICHARNALLQYIKEGSYIFWLDSDIIVPSKILEVLLSHFKRDPRIGWANVPTISRNPTLFEKVRMSRIPKRFRYVDEAELTCSLIHPEVGRLVGTFDPVNYYEVCSHYVRIHKSGWKILMDGSLSNKTIHLGRSPDAHWGKLYEPFEQWRYWLTFKRLLKMAYFYFVKFPRRPVHEMIKAGDLKLALKIAYWLILPYVLVSALFLWKLILLLFVLPAVLIYAIESRGRMKLITPIFQVIRWSLVAQGYAFFLASKVLSGFLSGCAKIRRL